MNAYPRNEAEAHAEIERASAFPVLPDAASHDSDPGPSPWPLIVLWLIAAAALITAITTSGCTSSQPTAQMDAEHTALAAADVERHGAGLQPLTANDLAWVRAHAAN